MSDLFDDTQTETFHMAGRPLVLRLTVPSHQDAGPFLAAVGKMRAAAAAGNFGEMHEALTPAFVADVFARWVAPAEPIRTKRGGTITTGAELYAIASPGLVMAVVGKLMNLASLTGADAKASGSPSTSDSVASGPASSDSPAPTTEPEGGPSPSIATEIPTAGA